MNGINGTIRLSITLLLAMLSLSACTSVKQFAGSYVPFYNYDGNYLDGIRVLSDADSNANLPVALDFLFISDDKVAQRLAKMSGPDWFAGKKGILLQNADSIVVTHLEVVPFTMEMPVSLPDKSAEAKKILMFANYLDKQGQFVADITGYHELRLTLGRNSYQLEELNP